MTQFDTEKNFQEFRNQSAPLESNLASVWVRKQLSNAVRCQFRELTEIERQKLAYQLGAAKLIFLIFALQFSEISSTATFFPADRFEIQTQ